MAVAPWIFVVFLLIALTVSVKRTSDLSFRLTQEKDARQKVRCLLRKAAQGVELFGEEIKHVKGMHEKFTVLHEKQQAQIFKLLRNHEEMEEICSRELE